MSRRIQKTRQITVVLVAMILDGLLFISPGLVKAQPLVEHAIFVPIQQVDVNGNGRSERVEGSLRL